MHKKNKVNGHVVHRLPKCPGLYYTVEPECRAVLNHFRMYSNASDVQVCWRPTIYGA